jgi:hypothetical protein
MVAHGVSTVLMMLMGHIGLVFEKILGDAGGTFLDIIVLQWATVPRLDFGMTYGIRVRPLRLLL